MAKSIPKEIKEKVHQIVTDYNKKNKTNFDISFRGRFAYLAKYELSEANPFLAIIAKRMGVSVNKLPQQYNEAIETKLGRLTYNGQIDNWDFAVFKYSRKIYDPNEFMFPGYEELDGTIEGALNAGLQLY